MLAAPGTSRAVSTARTPGSARGLAVDAPHLGMRVRRLHRPGVQHTTVAQRDVVHVERLAGRVQHRTLVVVLRHGATSDQNFPSRLPTIAAR
jgi:hypothetical protein